MALFVPNVPCGVESGVNDCGRSIKLFVPNVPCGVERLSWEASEFFHRPVPNVPCGVESVNRYKFKRNSCSFLMCRVELKVTLSTLLASSIILFLMCRVELKAKVSGTVLTPNLAVPNVPCGVESI